MKDISKLFKRVENIEYSIALSMLEQQTLNMSIKDQNGLDRYKNGFLVDNFKGYYAADITHTDYKACHIWIDSLDHCHNNTMHPLWPQPNRRNRGDEGWESHRHNG